MLPIRNQNNGSLAAGGRILSVMLMGLSFAAAARAQDPQAVPDISHMSIEDLMNVEVTSVSKRTQRVGDAPAAIFVITQEDIRRSGAASIPEALQMVPGLEVARIDENKWAIGSRGFNGRFDNKLLVLIDGRSVYTPLFSGVYWNIEDVMLEDVDRIEVIRGPGATLWGANAVDGVINIITKPAQATQGALATAEVGTEERAEESVRFGGKLGDSTYFRIYEKYFDWEPSVANGATANDGWDAMRGGFRVDAKPAGANTFTVQGDLYNSGYNETVTLPTLTPPYSSTFPNDGNYTGGNILGRWNHSFSTSSTTLQVYFDRTNVLDNYVFADHESVYDIDFQHDIHVGESQELVWGLGYRNIQDSNGSSPTVALIPQQSTLNQFSAFVQDDIGFFDRKLRLTIGSKFEHNDFTGFEFEPNIRFLANVTQNQSIWAAVSRAVRTPALTEEGLRLNEVVVPPGAPPFNSPLPVVEAIFGSTDFGSEDLLAYEAGYRVQATKTLSLDIAAFYNDYANLRSAEPGTPFIEGSPVPTDVVYPFVASNKMGGGTYGIEPYIEWKVLPKWKLSGSYSFLQMDIEKDKNSLDPTPDNPDGQSPKHQFFVRSSIDLPKHFEQDLSLRYVDKLPSLDIPSYYSLDGHFGWRPNSHLELSFTGQDLLGSRHLEFIPEFINTTPTEVRRTLSGKIAWHF
jgi:iron complex outermembrane recepter protein